MRVGGRINKASLDYHLKHPVLLPKEGHITYAIIRDHHEKVAYAGWGMTINEIRSHGYWIFNCTSAVKSVISKCVECRKLCRKICQQKMGNLPVDRLSKEPSPIVGLTCLVHFWPKMVEKSKRDMGSCLHVYPARQVHIEVTSNLTTCSFIQALRCLISRRGNVSMIRSDSGTNFVGASIELKKAFGEMDEKRINDFLMELGGEWISWKRNPPMASNMGGVWER